MIAGLADATEMWRLFAVVVLLFSFGQSRAQEPNKLDGAWKSNREITLAEIRQLPDLTTEQWSFLSDPTLFGHMVHVYQGNRSIAVFDNECGSITEFQILDSNDASVTIRYHDDFFEEDRTVTLVFEDGNLRVPIQSLRWNVFETFSPVPLPQILDQYPCVAALTR